MLITTTNNIEGKTITKYIGLVNGEAIIGANLVKDFFAGISDIVGGARVLTSKVCVKQKHCPQRND